MGMPVRRHLEDAGIRVVQDPVSSAQCQCLIAWKWTYAKGRSGHSGALAEIRRLARRGQRAVTD